MSKLCVRAFSVSLDGYGAGPDQSLENPLGVGGTSCTSGCSRTRTFQRCRPGRRRHRRRRRLRRAGLREPRRLDPGPQHVRPDPRPLAGRQLERLVGRRTRPITCRCSCSPTTRARRWRWKAAPTFHFVTDGIQSALAQAREAAGGKDIRIGGGVATVRQYLQAGLIDELHLADARRSCSAPARTCSPGSTCRRSATPAPTGSRRRRRRT